MGFFGIILDNIFVFLSFPSYRLYKFLYAIFGVQHNEDGFVPGFGLSCIEEGCGFYGVGEFFANILASFSGSGWVLSIDNGGYGLTLLSTWFFFFLIFTISVWGDTHILWKISQKNTKNSGKNRNKIFTGMYVFWRMFLPDFFIVGATFAKMCNINLSKEYIEKLNMGIQGIRIVLFAIAILLF